MATLSINPQEFSLLRDYIEKKCSISLSEEKKYLLESRLTRLVVENGCTSFNEFYHNVVSKNDPGIKNKIVDAMTTNETLWFRDSSPWVALLEQVLPELANRGRTIPGQKFRIWSAACSTGQEIYTIAMLIDDFCQKNPGKGLKPDRFEIMGTDISTSALFIAMAGRYDRISMNRGLVGDWERFKSRYFEKKGMISTISSDLKSRVQFKQYNLQDSFAPLGNFDIVFLRNVAIYFSDDFKRNLFARIKGAMNQKGYLFLGSAETLTGYLDTMERETHGKSSFYRNNGV
ncbi:MAG: protein-glutamate O-methyltransferase CheR [Deltaproteobacteria bacterium]|nr:protein-glutamate O-methyltransferase CheR [Deltaproteobacteria bacterium]